MITHNIQISIYEVFMYVLDCKYSNQIAKLRKVKMTLLRPGEIKHVGECWGPGVRGYIHHRRLPYCWFPIFGNTENHIVEFKLRS